MEKEFIAVDVSKETLDLQIQSKSFHFKINNSDAGLDQLFDIVDQQGIALESAWFVMEDTGHYCYRLINCLNSKGITFTVVNPLEIKRSVGIVRTKTDKADAATIARYAYQHRDTIKPSELKREVFLELGNLFSLRDKLVRQRAGFKGQILELEHCFDLNETDFQIDILNDLMSNLSKKIESIEKRMESLIASEKALKVNYKLATSVVGIGSVIATYLLITTENFTQFESAREYACYCGIAPFEKSSGTSIWGRTKVSHLANKKMKSLLDMAAKSAMTHDPELREYYQRKKQEGKNPKLVRNAVRSKLIHRVFSVIKRQTEYVKNGYTNIFFENHLVFSKS